jgi:hypothetical protein
MKTSVGLGVAFGDPDERKRAAVAPEAAPEHERDCR